MPSNRVVQAIIVSLCVATISAASKAYVDVERLKVSMTYIVDMVKETHNDVKYIKKYLLERREQ